MCPLMARSTSLGQNITVGAPCFLPVPVKHVAGLALNFADGKYKRGVKCVTSTNFFSNFKYVAYNIFVLFTYY